MPSRSSGSQAETPAPLADDSPTRYVVGIDLGTTNSVVSYADLATAPKTGDRPRLEGFGVPQLVAEGQVESRERLPSFLYLPHPDELPAGSLALPWDAAADRVVGTLARDRGGLVPGRLVASAKSWLCHAGVERTAPILPWAAAEDVERVSPVAASTAYLAHLRAAWDAHFAPDHPLAEQDVVLTVPASFDEVARELTLQAAEQAGLAHVTLVEEPQAVFYSWLADHPKDWADHVRADDLILVCDVGGGTSDFSLIQVEPRAGELGFRRIAVGDHLLLGGDNMDLALAASLETQLTGKSGKLDARQWAGLQQACRRAKESLLAEGGPATHAVTLAGRGRSLVGGTLRAELQRDQVLATLLDGFFPECPLEALPRRAGRGALQEFGLPYAAEPAITRQLAHFLRDPLARTSNAEGSDTPAFRRPTRLLFNGGVFQPKPLRERVRQSIDTWFADGEGVGVLDVPTNRLDNAVARGAAYYGLVRRGRGVRIHGGTARSFYVGLADESADAAPRVLCVAPQGLEEGEGVAVAGRTFELLLRQPVRFPFFASSTRPFDEAGQLVPFDEASMKSLPPVQTVLQAGQRAKQDHIAVRLRSLLTEVGTLEVWCEAVDSPRRWRLRFEVRRETGGQAGLEVAPGRADEEVGEEEVVEPERLEEAAARVREVFGPSGTGDAAEKLVRELEKLLGRRRDQWPIGALRELWPVVHECVGVRGTDAVRENRWLNLAGFLLRPGFGYPLDDWRVKDVWKLMPEGPKHRRDAQVAAGWWILWRRVAGGLGAGQQQELLARIQPTIVPKGGAGRPRRQIEKPTQEEVEMWRTAASLERIPAKRKVQLGKALLAGLDRHEGKEYEFWSLGRLGARQPFHGPADTVIPASEAADWARRILERKSADEPSVGFALVELARRTGDRTRDLDDVVRERVLGALEQAGVDDHRLELVRTGGESTARERASIFGESLPPALRLVDPDADAS